MELINEKRAYIAALKNQLDDLQRRIPSCQTIEQVRELESQFQHIRNEMRGSSAFLHAMEVHHHG